MNGLDRLTRLAFLSIAVTLGVGMTCSMQNCQAQQLLNQDKDALLEGFDVEPDVLAKYPAKQQGTKLGVFKLLSMAIPKIDLDMENGEAALNVKAPFVKVKLDADKRHISVKVPFVKVDTSTRKGINVKAPMVRVHTSIDNGISIQMPVIKFNPLPDSQTDYEESRKDAPANTKQSNMQPNNSSQDSAFAKSAPAVPSTPTAPSWTDAAADQSALEDQIH